MNRLHLLFLFFVFLFSCSKDAPSPDNQPDAQNPESPEDPGEDPGSGSSGDPEPLFGILQEKSFVSVLNESSEAIVQNDAGAIVQLVSVEGESAIWGLDQDLNLLWLRTIPDTRLFDIIPLSDGNFLGTGLADTQTDYSDGYVVKVDPQGTILWEQRFSGNDYISFSSAAESENGNIMLLAAAGSDDGFFTGNMGRGDAGAILLDADGTPIAGTRFGGSDNELLGKIIRAKDGTYLAAGFSASTDGDVPGVLGITDIWVIRFSEDLTLLDSKTFGSEGTDDAFDLVELNNGNFLIAGVNNDGGGDTTSHSGGGDARIIILDPSLNIINEGSFGAGDLELARKVLPLANGNFLMLGISWSEGELSGSFRGSCDYWILELSPSLTTLNQALIGGSKNDFINSGLDLGNGEFLITGSTLSDDKDVSSNNGGYDVWIVRYKL